VGGADAALQSWTTSVLLNGVRQYRRVVVGEPWLEKKLHFNNTFKLTGGWQAGASALVESFAFDPTLYQDYALQGPAGAILPFTGAPYIHNNDYVVTLDTPQFARFSGSVFYLWGHDENFFEWSPASIVFATYAADWRPNEKLRLNAQYQLQSYERRSDRSTVGVRKIPRVKAEYQVSRAIFLRFIAEYDARRQDTLRDDTRTELPILIRIRRPDSMRHHWRSRTIAFASTRCSRINRRQALWCSPATAASSRNRRGCNSVSFDVLTTAFFSRSAIYSGFDVARHMHSAPQVKYAVPTPRRCIRAGTVRRCGVARV